MACAKCASPAPAGTGARGRGEGGVEIVETAGPAADRSSGMLHAGLGCSMLPAAAAPGPRPSQPGTHAGARSQQTRAGLRARRWARWPPAAPSPPPQSAWRAPQTRLAVAVDGWGWVGWVVGWQGARGTAVCRQASRRPSLACKPCLQALPATALRGHPRMSPPHPTPPPPSAAAHPRCKRRPRWRRTRRAACSACAPQCAPRPQCRGSSAQSLRGGAARGGGRSGGSWGCEAGLQGSSGGSQ